MHKLTQKYSSVRAPGQDLKTRMLRWYMSFGTKEEPLDTPDPCRKRRILDKLPDISTRGLLARCDMALRRSSLPSPRRQEVGHHHV